MSGCVFPHVAFFSIRSCGGSLYPWNTRRRSVCRRAGTIGTKPPFFQEDTQIPNSGVNGRTMDVKFVRYLCRGVFLQKPGNLSMANGERRQDAGNTYLHGGPLLLRKLINLQAPMLFCHPDQLGQLVGPSSPATILARETSLPRSRIDDRQWR